jgi:hypothetical protein
MSIDWVFFYHGWALASSSDFLYLHVIELLCEYTIIREHTLSF